MQTGISARGHHEDCSCWTCTLLCVGSFSSSEPHCHSLSPSAFSPCSCPGGFPLGAPGQPCPEKQECSRAGVKSLLLLSFLPSTAHPQLPALSFPSGLSSICLLEGCKGESQFMGAQRLQGNRSAAQPWHACTEGGLVGPVFRSHVTKQGAF